MPLLTHEEVSSFDELKAITHSLIKAEVIRGPLIKQLQNSLRQAENHFTAKRYSQAIHFLTKYEQQVNRPAHDRHVGTGVRKQLTPLIADVMTEWEDLKALSEE